MKPNDSPDEKQPRNIKDGPFCWQHKKQLRMITDTFSESEQGASARSVYVALTELASDNGNETFTATKALIAHKAGLSVSTVQRLLKGLEQLGVVHIEGQFAERNSGAIRAPNTYTLLASGHGDVTTLSHGRSRSNPDKVKENKENKKSTPPTEESHPRALRAAEDADSVSNYDFEEQEKLQLFRQILSDPDPQWLPINKYSFRVSDALAVWDLDDVRRICEAAAMLVAEGRDESNFTVRNTGEQFDCYLPKANKRTGKRTLVRLLQCNR
jgi:Helix-turn-helix domain